MLKYMFNFTLGMAFFAGLFFISMAEDEPAVAALLERMM